MEIILAFTDLNQLMYLSKKIWHLEDLPPSSQFYLQMNMDRHGYF